VKRVRLLDQSDRSGGIRVRAAAIAAFPTIGGALSARVPFAPDVDWPLAPAVERAIMSAMREAISVGLSIAEITEQLTDILHRFEIELSPDDVRSIVGAHVMGGV
jgi:hypothetical protein